MHSTMAICGNPRAPKMSARIRKFGFVILLGFLLVVVPTGPFAQEHDLEAKVDLWIATLDLIEEQIAGGTIDDAQITALERRVRAVLDEAKQFRTDAEAALAPLQREQAAIGVESEPAPDSADREATLSAEPPPPQIATRADAQLRGLEEKIAEVQSRVRQADLVLTRAQDLLHRLAELSSRRTTERIFSRGPSMFLGDTWKAAGTAFAALIDTLAGRPAVWWAESRPAATGLEPWILAFATGLLAFAATFSVRRWLCRRYGYDPGDTNPGYGRIVLAATVEGSTRGLGPMLALIAFGATLVHLGIARPETTPLLFAGGVGIISYLLTINIIRAVFSPHAPQWRLLPMGSERAQKIGYRLRWFAIYLAVVTAINTAWNNLGVDSPELEGFKITILNSGGAFLLFLLIDSSLWQSGQKPETASDREMTGISTSEPESKPRIPALLQLVRLLSAAALLAVPVSAIAGYYELARHITRVITLSAVVIGATFLFRVAIHELIRWLLAPGDHAVGPLGRILSLRREGSERLTLLFRFVTDIFLGLFAILMLLLIAGVPQTTISVAVGDFLDGVTIGDFTFSPGDILIGITIFIVGILVTRYLARVLDQKLLPRTRLDIGVRNSLTAAASYSGFILAGVIGIAAMGLDLSNLAIIAGALSVGIGFGLREVVNNFVSGLLLLIERPVKVGDWIVVGPHEGTVRKISVRSTEIETFDRADVIIPNSELITGAVTNWTHRSKMIRITLTVGVAYGTDPQKVHDILLKLPEGFDEITKQPAPYVIFRDFGESSLDFELRFYLRDVSGYFTVPTKLRLKLVRIFEQEGITIPFPQRDIHIIPSAVPLESGAVASDESGAPRPAQPAT